MQSFPYPVSQNQPHKPEQIDYFQNIDPLRNQQQYFYPPNYAAETYPISTDQAPLQTLPFNPVQESAFNNPFVQNVAMQYGSEVLDHGHHIVQNKIQKIIPMSRLKYYFAVDNSYVANKLSVLLFPFFRSTWSLKYDSAGPVPPRSDLNSPDLYIPLMSFLTYILIAAVCLGVNSQFSPESLGVFSSQSLGWLIFEVCILTLALYILNIQQNLGYLDILAYSSYKFFHMAMVIVTFLFIGKPGYYFALIWTSIAYAFFQIQSLRRQILAQPSLNPRSGTYYLAGAALFQPFIIWWLTSWVTVRK